MKFFIHALIFFVALTLSSLAFGATLITDPANSHYCQGTTGLKFKIQNSVSGITYKLRKPLSGPGDLATVVGNGGTVTFPGDFQAGTYITVPNTNPVTVVMDPQPTSFTVTMVPTNGKFCDYPDAVGVEIILTGSQVGANYEVFLGSVSQGTAWPGDGSSHSFGYFKTSGTYVVKSTIIATSCTRTMGNAVVVANALPVASYTFAITNPCSNTPVQFTSTSPGTGLTYLWRFDDDNSGQKNLSILQNPLHLFEAWGNGTETFDVSLRVTNANGCKDTVVHQVTVTQKPDATLIDILNPLNPSYPNTFSYCGANNANPNGFFEFHNESTTMATNTLYNISWGNCTTTPTYNSSTFADNIPITYTCLGEQTITYSVNGQNGCNNQRTYGLFVGSNPGGGLTTAANTYGVAPFSLDFIIPEITYNNTPGTMYVYDYGDGSYDTLYQETLPANGLLPHTYTTCSSVKIDGQFAYRASCRVTNPCGFTNPTVFPIWVSCMVTGGFQGNWGTGGIGWFPGDPDSSHIVGCNPVAFSNTTVPGFYIYPSGTSSTQATYYNWNFGDPASGTQNFSTLASPVHTFTTSGQTYTVTLITYTGQSLNNNSGIDTIVKQLYIQTDPTADFDYDTTEACVPKYVQMNDLSNPGGLGIPQYIWTVTPPNGWQIVTTGHEGDNTIPEPLFKFTAMGQPPSYTYTVELALINSCDTSFKEVDILVCEPPEVAFAANEVWYCGPGPKLISPAYDLNCDSSTIEIQWLITPSAGITFNDGTTDTSYAPVVNFPDYGDYQVNVIINNGCGADTAILTVHITQLLSNNTISLSPSQFCGCKAPITITGEVPLGGSGSYTYQWEKNSGTGWIQIPVGGTGLNYLITTPLCETTLFRRAAYDAGDCSDISNVVEVTIYPTVQNNLIFADQSVCGSNLPAEITGTIPFGGSSPFTYSWEQSTDGGSIWSEIPGATSINYQPELLTQTTYFRRVAVSSPCQPDNSAPVVVNVCAPITNNTISIVSDEVCAGSAPAPIMGTDPTGACGLLAFQWQKSDVPPFTAFVNISGAVGPTYQPTQINVVTHYRRIVSSSALCPQSTSNEITVNVNPRPVAEAGVYAPIPNGWNITLTGTSSGGTLPYQSYLWTPESLISGSANQPVVTSIPLTSTTTFTYTVTDDKGCIGSDIAVISITGNILTCSVTANPSSVCPTCPNGPSHICANASGGSGNYTYSWTSSPPGFLSTQACIDVCPTTSTNYSCVVWDGFASCNSNTTISVDPVPVVTSSLVTDICSGDTVNYVPASTVTGTTYTWTTVPGTCTGNTSGQGLKINDRLVNNGTAICQVTYTITPHGPAPNFCTGTAVNLVVNVMPVAQISNPSTSQVVVSGQLSLPVTFTSNVADANFYWEFFSVNCTGFIGPYIQNGNTALLPAQIITILPGGPSTCTLKYKVTPWVTLPGGTQCWGTPFYYNFIVNTEPMKYNLLCPPPVCAGNPVSVVLDGSDVGIDYQLLKSSIPVPGGLQHGTGDTLEWPITTSGTYTILATNTGNLQSVLMNGQCAVTINPNPIANYVIGSTGNCPGDIITQNGSQTGVIYELYNGNVNTLISRTGPGPLDFGPQENPGTYKIKATYPLTGCNVWIDSLILIAPAPEQFNFNPAGPLCAGDEFSLANSEPGILYSLICTPTTGSQFSQGPWMGGTGAISFGPQFTPGVYKVLAYNPLTGCDAYMDDEKIIWPNPVSYNITPPGNHCGLTEIGLDNSETGFTYQVYKIDPATGNPYILPDPNFAMQTGVSGQPLVFGSTSIPWTYCVIAFDQNNICRTQMNGLVVVQASPTKYQMIPVGDLCFDPGIGREILLEHSDLGVEYTLFLNNMPWSAPKPGLGGTGPLSFGFITVPGSYTISARNVLNNCTETMYGSCTLLMNPVRYTLNPLNESCPGVDIWLSGSQPDVTYQLHPPSGPLLSMQGTGNPLHWGVKYQPGNYYVTAQSIVTACNDTMTGWATINSRPGVFQVKPQGINCELQDIGLENSEAGTTYEIVHQDGSSLTTPVTVTTTSSGSFWFNAPQPAGTYKVRAITAQGCDTLMTGEVVIDPRPTADAGPIDITVCNLPPYAVALNGSATNFGSVTWSSPTNPSGSNFSDPHSLTPTYTFTAADIANQQVVLTLTVTGTAGCTSASATDQITVIIQASMVDAGPDQQVCVFENITLAGSVTGGTTTGTWTGGAGTFIPDRQTLTAVYDPDPSETGTTITLTLNSTNADPCPDASDVMTIKVFSPVAAGAAGADQTICYGQVPQPVSATLPTGGSGTYAYQWQQSDGGSWSDIPGATSLSYSPPLLTTTAQYRVIQTDLGCMPQQSAASNVVTIIVSLQVQAGALGTGQTICYGESPAPLVAASPSGGSGTFAYVWQSRSGTGGWNNIPGATVLSYSPGPTTITTDYRVVQTDTWCNPIQEVITNVVTITVHGQLLSGSASAEQTICRGEIPVSLVLTPPQGGSGTYAYQWQAKAGSGTWNNIPSAIGVSYAPPALFVNTQYRVIQTDIFCSPDQEVTSNVVTITVHGELVAGTAGTDQTICHGETPAPLTVTLPGGGSSNFTSQWQSRVNSGVWVDIPSANDLTYGPSALTVTTQYRVIQKDTWCTPDQEAISNIVTVFVHGQLTAGNTTLNQTICFGETPASLTTSAPAGGSGNFIYQWQAQTGFGIWNNILGATSLVYSPPALTETTKYRTIQQDTWCNPDQVVQSNEVTITVHGQLTAGSAGIDQTICYGETPEPITVTAPSGGSGTFSYQWQSQTGSGAWNNIPSAIGLVYNPPALTETTKYRVIQTDAFCNPDQQATSNVVTVEVPGQLLAGNAGSDQAICYGETPDALGVTTPSGGSGTFAYQWQSKTNGGSWINISNANSLVYSPPALFETTQFRVVQGDMWCDPDQEVVSNTVTVTVYGLLVAGSAGADQTICYGEIPAPILAVTPSGGSSSYGYQWQLKVGSGNWVNIPGATNLNHAPAALTVTTTYRLLQSDSWCEPDQQVTTNVVTITVRGQLVAGIAGADQTLCNGETPDPVVVAVPSGGSGNFTCQWQSKTATTPWNNIPGANTLSLSPVNLLETTQYRAIQVDGFCNPHDSVTSNVITITVNSPLTGGVAGSGQSICYGEIPLPVNVTVPSGGSGNFAYQWQQLTGTGSWTNLLNANAMVYSPPSLTETTRYRVVQTDGTCLPAQVVISNEVVVVVFGQLLSGTATSNQTICNGETPDPILVSVPGGGSGSMLYQWQMQAGSGTWNNIPGATTGSFTSSPLYQTTRYRVIQKDTWCEPDDEVISNQVTITVYNEFISGTAGLSQTICFGQIPAPLQVTLPAGGSGNVTYQWQLEGPAGIWSNIAGANDLIYTPGALTLTSRFRVVQTDISCNPFHQVTSNAATINVYDQLTAGTSGADQTICYGETPDPLTAVIPTGGSGTFTYNWQVKDGFGAWNNINGATTLTYNPPALFTTTQYRITQTDTYCNPDQKVGSNAVTITVHSEFIAGSAGTDQTVCMLEQPATITATLPVGGSGNHLFRWQSKIGTGVWMDIPNAQALSYTPPPLTQTTRFRLQQKDTWCDPDHVVNTNEVIITVVPIPMPTIGGPPLVCINSTGNVYQTEPDMLNYEWTITGGTVTAGGAYNDPTVTVTWTTQGLGTVSVNYHENIHNCPAAAPTVYQVNVVLPPVPVIATSPPNTTVGCIDACITFETEPGMTNYQWVASPGGVICSLGQTGDRRAVVKWSSAGFHWLSVNYTGTAGCPATLATVYPVTIIPAPTPTISGPNFICEGGLTATYTTEAGMSGYLWNVPAGGTIAAGQGTNMVTVLWNVVGNHSINVTYTNYFGCGAISPANYAVSVTPLPVPLLAGPVAACIGSSGNVYTTNPGNSGYIWTPSAGGVIISGGGPNDYTATIQWNSAGYQSVSVTYTDVNGCEPTFPTTVNVFVNPAPVPAINGPATVCSSINSVVYSTQPGMSGYSWTVSSGGQILNGTGTNIINVNWFTSGAQTVSVNYTGSAGCNATNPSTFNVVVSERPFSDFEADTVCQGSPTTFTNLSTNTSGPIVNYLWNFGDGYTSQAASPVHLYGVAGSYAVTLTATNAAGCVKDTVKPVHVWGKPTALFSNTVSNCAGDSVQFTDLSSAIHGYITRWTWDFGDGTTPLVVNFPNNPNVKHKFNNGGSFNVKLTIVTSDSCVAQKINLVSVGTKPLANFTNGTGSCAMIPLQFTDLSQLNGGPPITAWSWNFGEPSTGTSNYSTFQNPMHVYQSGGPFTVNLMVTNANGCIDSISKPLTVNATPLASFTVDSSCIQTPTQFNDESTSSSGTVVAWSWNFGDPSSGLNNTSTLQDPVHIFNTPGIYWVTLQVTNSNQCVKDTSIMVITNARPIADFQQSVSCMQDFTQFTDLSIAPNSSLKSWQWDFGDGGSAAIQNPVHAYQTAGTFSVKLIVTNLFNCTDTVIKPVVVRYKPLSGFNFQNYYCPPNRVDFQDSSQAYGGAFIQERTWIFESGHTSSVVNPTHYFTENDTTYEVTLMVKDNFGCRDTIVRDVFVKPAFVIAFTNDTACFGQETHFQAENTALGDTLYTLRWDFGDPDAGPNNYSTVINPVHQFTKTGNFTVWLKAWNSENCVDSVYKLIQVRKLTEPGFAYQSLTCNDTVRFQDESKPGFGTITSWKWIWGDGTPPLVITPPFDGDTSHIFDVEGTYPVKLIVTNSHGCIDSIVKSVSVACITATFSQINAFNCSSDSIAFLDSSSPANKIATWHWDFGDSKTLDYTSHRDTIRHKFPPGSYQVSLTIQTSSGGATVTSVFNLTTLVHAAPVAGFSANAVCTGDSTRFVDLALDNQVPITSREWKFGDGASVIYIDTIINPVHKYSHGGTFYNKFIVKNSIGCMDSVTMPVAVHNLPVASFVSSAPCQRYDVQFTDGSFNGDTTMQLWWWNFNDPQNPYDTLRSEEVTHRFDSTGAFPIYLRVMDKNGCTDDTLNTAFEIRQSPVAAFTYTDNFDGKQGKIKLNNESTGAKDKAWKWDFGNGKTSVEKNPVVTYINDNQVYTIELVTWNEQECYDTTWFAYEFFFDNLFVPNAFSPTSLVLGVREFKPKGLNLSDYHVMVFDKWGHLLWESIKVDETTGQPSEGWDGTFNGELMPQDVYMWKINAKFINGKVWEGSDSGTGSSSTMGTVTLIR